AVREAFRGILSEEWGKIRNSRLLSVAEEWKTFKETVMMVAARVCGYKRVGRKSKRSAWWDDEMKVLVKDKRRLFETYNQNKSGSNREEYKRKKQEVKRTVREKQNVADERLGQCLSKNFRENKKLFWSGVNRERKSREQLDVRIKDADGNVVTEERAVLDRWSEYYEQLLNVDDGRAAVLTDARVCGINENMRLQMEVSLEDVRKAVKKLKKGKAPGVDGITSEMLCFGGDSVLEWLTRVCRVCMTEGVVPKDWQKAIIVPLYKGKGDRGECKNYRGISLLSIPGKVYGRILIERVRGMTEGMIGEEQCGFRMGRGCVDQVFSLKQLSEKYIGKGKDLYVAYMDLEKAYDRIDRDAMWRVLQMYGINGNLLRAIQSLYADSEGSVRVCREESKWFSVKVGLRQGCVMSPWLFNIFMDGVMKEVREKAGDVGANMWDARRNCEWKVEWMMFADDTVLVGDSEQKLQKLVKEFGRVCKRRKLAVNVGKSKIMRIGKNRTENEMNISLNNNRMEEVECYRYLGVDIAHDGRMNDEVSHRIGEARKVSGALQKLWKNRRMSMEAKVGMYEGIIEPTLLYGCEAWVLNVHERRKVEAVEMSCLRSICGVRRIDRIPNVEIRRRCGKSVGVGERMDQGVLRWFGHVERMGEERLVRRVYDSDVRGMRGRGRPRKCWMDGVREVLNRKGLDIQEAKVCVQDRSEWRSVCRGVRRAAGELPV
ncbi:MAG: reverse transcriptase family protein, partial [Pseudomonadota bacterium]